MTKNLITKTLNITPEQHEWLEAQSINFSSLIRKFIDYFMACQVPLDSVLKSLKELSKE